MQKWEYISVVASGSGQGGGETNFYNGQTRQRVCDGSENEVVKFLNQLGRDGWELVSANYHQNNLGVRRAEYVLKRPLP